MRHRCMHELFADDGRLKGATKYFIDTARTDHVQHAMVVEVVES